jgi:AraC family transcriptional regulator
MQILSGQFCGTQLAKRHTAGLHVVESVFLPNETLPWHTHRWPYFTFVLRGGYTEECHSRSFDIAEGDVVLHGAGEAHADRMHGAECCLLNLEFTQPWIDRIAVFGARLDFRVTCNGGEFLQLGKRLHRELWSDERISALCIEGLALELVAHGTQYKAKEVGPPSWLLTAIDYLRAHFTGSPSLLDVADAAGVHPVHLAREFRRRQGVTVGEYVRKLRVDFVCDELIGSEQPIVDVALKAGFSDHSHMTRVFRQETGLTPSEFRHLRRHGCVVDPHRHSSSEDSIDTEEHD